MPNLLDILSAKLNGEIRDETVTTQEVVQAESRFGRILPPQLSELLIAANGLSFEPPANLRGREVLGIFSLWQIERTLETLGEFIPAFLLPFAHSLLSYYCLDGDARVYEVTGIGEQTPRIVIDPLDLSLKMFVEELEPNA
jgi:hypothetical protein